MRWSKAFIPTLKEAPADASSVSHSLLMRGGYIRRLGAGIYEFLPLGLRVLRKIEGIIREEMDGAGAHEVLLPALLPAEYFRETGRWDIFGDNLLRLKDRKGGDYHLGPTHEEIITDLVRREVHSYRDLPKILYQVQTKFRDEARPRGGLLRCREFIMKDAYSFDVDLDHAVKSYETMREAYRNIFDRIGLTYRLVLADSGSMGGSTSAEFQVLVQSGEDAIAACKSCEYAANIEVARAATGVDEFSPNADTPAMSKVHTPNVGTIEEVSNFLKRPATTFLKSLLFVADGQVVMAVVRGDHDVNEVKLSHVLGVDVDDMHLADDETIRRQTGARVGFAGPVGFEGKIIIDRDAAAVHAAITGANEDDHHLVDVEPGRDFEARIADIRTVMDGDRCPNCDHGELQLFRGIEGGHIFVLGTHYSSKMNASFLDEQGDEKDVVMGCYGIGVSRLVATAVEQFHDDNGIVWPMAVAPYQVHVINAGPDEQVYATAEKLTSELEALGVEVLWDDRKDRPGVKFKDADLVGAPLRVTIGKRGLKQGAVELKPRNEPDPKKSEMIPIDEAAQVIADKVRAMLAKR